MENEKSNPCNNCARSLNCPTDCALHTFWHPAVECHNRDCFLNYELGCLINIDYCCGANPECRFEEDE